ncbi:Flagellar P-ring protein precursor [Thalassoglobus neptunius]|uniref:Flagellar P-ring protein n=1 Tax=Thalassoglobus neptunius TaxID=1938619 RepID=A0A5C5VWG0_9PLAN|nr:flagellar basal body P-ring protein FlgI [Thalassoglobus neptunius]TWT43016.1 Flagellar P-ring protein precursor [Thalassoglobus neptunius]
MFSSTKRQLFFVLILLHTAQFSTDVDASEVRIQDITTIQGVQRNQLVGMGLVTGLDGTGGRSPVTRRFALNMLQRFGVRSDPSLRSIIERDTAQRTDNISVVTVTADLSSLDKQGSQIDVLVSAFDDAESLQGGQLIMTPLFGADGEVYAIASGPLSIGGFSFSGQGASVQKNHPTTGRIPNGAVVEMGVGSGVGCGGRVRLLLTDPSLETARRISDVINQKFPQSTIVGDAGSVEIWVPESFHGAIPEFLAIVEMMTVIPDVPARVVINERTGTIIVGEHVKLSKVLITHANLAVSTAESPEVSQPAPFSDGVTAIVPRTDIVVEEEDATIAVLEESVTVGELAQALNALGVAPRDLSSIFQMLKESGSLHAQLLFK